MSAEPIQTVRRRYGVTSAHERLRVLTRRVKAIANGDIIHESSRA